MSITIYHNPRCTKSRQTLALLEARGVSPKIVTYLDDAPSVTMLNKLMKQLDCAPREMMRTKEAVYKALGLADSNLSQQVLLQAMHDNPKLIERPIVTDGKRAVIGRPPENVLRLLD